MQIDSSIRYLEIVTPDVAGTVAVFEKSSAVKFSDPIEALGNARTAPMAGEPVRLLAGLTIYLDS